MDVVIRGAHVVRPQRVSRLDVAIENGKIAALLAPGATCPAHAEIDADGLILLPGLVDTHVHLREPGLTHKETIITGTMAAACGGVTTVLDMPNTMPPVTDPAILRSKGHHILGQAWVDVGLYALLGPGMNHNRLHELLEAGCVGFKLFLGPTTGNLQAPGWGELLALCHDLASLRIPLVVHAEDREVVEWQGQVQDDVPTYEAFLASRPAWGEVDTTARMCRLAGSTGVRVHIAHVSQAEAVDVIQVAKQRGWPVTAETCPPYLFLTANDYPRVGNQMKVLPPIRYDRDQQKLWEGLHYGAIDTVATDHAPHTEDEKARPLAEAASGAAGVETMLPLLLNAVHQGRCTLQDIALWCAEAPASRFGLHGKGRITPGAWADLVLVDMEKNWMIEANSLHSLSPQNPFCGQQGRGAPVCTFLRGQVIAAEGEPVGEPTGEWVRPIYSSRAH